MIRPSNYYASLDSRISGAVAHTADPRQLWLLIAETELALAAAPDPESLREALSQLKQTHALFVQAVP
jgi:hypothetical protein